MLLPVPSLSPGQLHPLPNQSLRFTAPFCAPFLDCILSMGNLNHAFCCYPYPYDPTQPTSLLLISAITLAPLPAPALPHTAGPSYASGKDILVCSEPDKTPRKLGVLSNFSLSLTPPISKPSHLSQFNSQIALEFAYFSPSREVPPCPKLILCLAWTPVLASYGLPTSTLVYHQPNTQEP